MEGFLPPLGLRPLLLQGVGEWGAVVTPQVRSAWIVRRAFGQGRLNVKLSMVKGVVDDYPTLVWSSLGQEVRVVYVNNEAWR